MPKIASIGLGRKIGLSQIIETGNVRFDYQNIDELAGSIKNYGLIQPIAVKSMGINEQGVEQFELIAGHRRLRAFKWLVENGEDFNQIDAIVKTGEKNTLQLIENIQREQLNAVEREKAIKAMIDGGFAIKEIAHRLCKSEDWVRSQVAVCEIRTIAENAGVDTAQMSTNTLRVTRSIPKEEIPAIVREIKDNGGTQKAAVDIVKRKKSNSEYEKEAIPEKMVSMNAVCLELFVFAEENIANKERNKAILDCIAMLHTRLH
ncbi:MAG: ParB/RepB/Spo0J family partition protein [Treponemataceae bacterium]